MKKHKGDRTLTRAEMEIMNILRDSGTPMSTHAIIAAYPGDKPA